MSFLQPKNHVTIGEEFLNYFITALNNGIRDGFASLAPVIKADTCTTIQYEEAMGAEQTVQLLINHCVQNFSFLQSDRIRPWTIQPIFNHDKSNYMGLVINVTGKLQSTEEGYVGVTDKKVRITLVLTNINEQYYINNMIMELQSPRNRLGGSSVQNPFAQWKKMY